jgi:cytochrome c1
VPDPLAEPDAEPSAIDHRKSDASAVPEPYAEANGYADAQADAEPYALAYANGGPHDCAHRAPANRAAPYGDAIDRANGPTPPELHNLRANVLRL